jgi:leader peptidase (prepilin peptidase)/N-methyltransferase
MMLAPPLWIGLLAAAGVGLIAGSWVNWATYTLAWNRRPISPWAPRHEQTSARTLTDRLPLWGWLGLRRESHLHGAGFWRRPFAVELFMAIAWAALYWWEVDRQGLIHHQFEALAGRPLQVGAFAAPAWITLATFLSHAILLTLMAAASLIDFDEKTIPDGVTTPGTLLALALAAVAPMSLPPHVALRLAPPAAGVAVPLPANVAAQANGATLYVEPLSLASPNDWPAWLGGAPSGASLTIGLACFALWWVALTPRIMRWRRGMLFGLRVLAARSLRELLRPRSALIGLIGFAAIAGVWYRGGESWLGLLTALVGMVGGGAMVWAVRIVGSAALRKEAMGFGDVTLMMMIGAFLGWQPTIFIFFMAPFAGLLIGVAQMILRRDDVIPYGPFLCLAATAVTVWWAWFWNQDPHGFQAIFELGWLLPMVLALGVVMLGAMLVIWRNIKEAMFGVEYE